MSDIGELLAQAWEHREDWDSPEHIAVLDELDRTGSSLSPELRGRCQNYLKMAILDGADRHDAYLFTATKEESGKSGGKRIVDESRCPREIAWFGEFASQIEYSAALDTWLSAKRHSFVDAMRKSGGLTDAINRWPALTPGERHSLLIEIMRLRIDTFSDSEISFQMPEIEIVEDDVNNSPAGAYASVNKIRLSKSIFLREDPSLPLMWIYHEGTHNLLTQLAKTYRENLIQPSHPLFEDAGTAEFARRHRVLPTNEMESAYGSDAEEQIAYPEQEFFLSNLYRGYGLKAKFDCVRDMVRHGINADHRTPVLRPLLDYMKWG